MIFLNFFYYLEKIDRRMKDWFFSLFFGIFSDKYTCILFTSYLSRVRVFRSECLVIHQVKWFGRLTFLKRNHQFGLGLAFFILVCFEFSFHYIFLRKISKLIYCSIQKLWCCWNLQRARFNWQKNVIIVCIYSLKYSERMDHQECP